MNTHVKQISLMGLFISLGISLGFALSYIPNVELITATVFISGYLLGTKQGFIVGLITEAIYSTFNPFGLAAPPIFFAQILCMGVTGFFGGVLQKQKTNPPLFYMIKLGSAGFLLTSFFAVLTSFSFALFMGFSRGKLLASLISGLGFYIIHIVANTIIFLTLVPLLLNIIKKAGFTFQPLPKQVTS